MNLARIQKQSDYLIKLSKNDCLHKGNPSKKEVKAAESHTSPRADPRSCMFSPCSTLITSTDVSQPPFVRIDFSNLLAYGHMFNSSLKPMLSQVPARPNAFLQCGAALTLFCVTCIVYSKGMCNSEASGWVRAKGCPRGTQGPGDPPKVESSQTPAPEPLYTTLG